jgi:hypothetical protein
VPEAITYICVEADKSVSSRVPAAGDTTERRGKSQRVGHITKTFKRLFFDNMGVLHIQKDRQNVTASNGK